MRGDRQRRRQQGAGRGVGLRKRQNTAVHVEGKTGEEDRPSQRAHYGRSAHVARCPSHGYV